MGDLGAVGPCHRFSEAGIQDSLFVLLFLLIDIGRLLALWCCFCKANIILALFKQGSRIWRSSRFLPRTVDAVGAHPRRVELRDAEVATARSRRRGSDKDDCIYYEYCSNYICTMYVVFSLSLYIYIYIYTVSLSLSLYIYIYIYIEYVYQHGRPCIRHREEHLIVAVQHN